MTGDLSVDRTGNRSVRIEIEEEERSFGFSLFCVFWGFGGGGGGRGGVGEVLTICLCGES